jgi:hypothetical protein
LIAVTDRRESLIFRDRYTSIGLIRKGVFISIFDVCYCSKLRRESRYSAEAASGHVAVAGFVLVLQVILSLSPAELLITDTKFDHRTTLGDKMETAPNLMQLGLNSTLHACENCGASEFDANGMERYGNIEKTVLRYRGHKVISGASRGCVLFQDCLRKLHAVLQSQGHPEGAWSASFRAQNWVYSITVSRDMGHYHDLEVARGLWPCLEGEVSNGNRHPDTEATYYTLLAVPGESVITLQVLH